MYTEYLLLDGHLKLGLDALAVRKLDPFYTLREARRLLRNMWIGNPLESD
jgi:hypothetical protein